MNVCKYGEVDLLEALLIRKSLGSGCTFKIPRRFLSGCVTLDRRFLLPRDGERLKLESFLVLQG